MDQTILEILSTEDIINQERIELEAELNQKKDYYVNEVDKREKELNEKINQEIVEYEKKQRKLLDEAIFQSTKWTQEKSDELSKLYEENKNSVVDKVIKEVKSIYGHF